MSPAIPIKPMSNLQVIISDSSNNESSKPTRSSGRRVTFNETVQVVLIPCIQEYKDAKLFRSIWWDQTDMRSFQIAMGISFRKFLETAVCDSLRQALRLFIEDELANSEVIEQHEKRSMLDTLVTALEVQPPMKRIRV